MLTLIREYSLDVWDWIVGKRYPRQELLESLKEPDRQFPALNLKTNLKGAGPSPDAWERSSQTTESEIRANLTAETRLVKRSNIADLKEAVLVRGPSLVGLWESEARDWHETHPESSVCITQLKPRPRILPAYQSEHEEF